MSLQFAFLQAGKRFFAYVRLLPRIPHRRRPHFLRCLPSPSPRVVTDPLVPYRRSGRNASGEPLSLGQYYLAGSFAGVGNSFVSGPVEHVRIRLQTQTSNIYSGPLDAVKKIYRADGLRGVYHGQGATLAR